MCTYLLADDKLAHHTLSSKARRNTHPLHTFAMHHPIYMFHTQKQRNTGKYYCMLQFYHQLRVQTCKTPFYLSSTCGLSASLVLISSSQHVLQEVICQT